MSVLHISAKKINWKFAIWVLSFWKSRFPFYSNESGNLYGFHNMFGCFLDLCLGEGSFEFYVSILTMHKPFTKYKKTGQVKANPSTKNPISSTKQ